MCPHGQHQLQDRFNALFDALEVVAAAGGDIQMDIAVPGMAEGIDLHPKNLSQTGQLFDKLGDAADGHHDILGNIEAGLFLDAK